MNIRTLEALEDALDAAFAWRRKELSTLLTAIRSAAGQQQKLQLRAGIALLYAHWEGFIKSSAEAYIEYVAGKKLSCEKLASNFMALAIGRLLNDARDSKRVSFRIAAVEFVRNETGANAPVPTKGINTSSNLNSDVLSDIISIVGVDGRPYETKRNLIDESLLAARNKIAHGEYLEIDAGRYEALQQEIISLMQLFRNQISNAAATKLYLRFPDSLTMTSHADP